MTSFYVLFCFLSVFTIAITHYTFDDGILRSHKKNEVISNSQTLLNEVSLSIGNKFQKKNISSTNETNLGG